MFLYLRFFFYIVRLSNILFICLCLSHFYTFTCVKSSVWIAGGGVGGLNSPTVFPTPLAHCQIISWGSAMYYIQYTYDLCHSFGRTSDRRTVQPLANFSQFKHWWKEIFIAFSVARGWANVWTTSPVKTWPTSISSPTTHQRSTAGVVQTFTRRDPSTRNYPATPTRRTNNAHRPLNMKPADVRTW